MTVTTTHAPHRGNATLIGVAIALLGLVLLIALVLSTVGSSGSSTSEAPAIVPAAEADGGCGIPAQIVEAERTTMQELCRSAG